MRRANPWGQIGLDAWLLGVEAASVMTLRGLKLASGGDPDGAETQRMIREKVEAAQALQSLALSGGLGLTAPGAARKTLAHYRRKVRANRRRLLK